MANEMFTFTEEEMIDIYDYIESAGIVTIFDMLDYIIETAEAEEVPKRFEAMEKDFREDFQRLQNKISKKVFETLCAIGSASLCRAFDELSESKESED